MGRKLLGIISLIIIAGVAITVLLGGRLMKPILVEHEKSSELVEHEKSSEVEVIKEKTEQINSSKYQAEIVYSEEKYGEKIETYVMIHYKLGEKEYGGRFYPEFKNALDWIKNNTTEEVVFLCLPEYRGMVKGYSERETIVDEETIINSAQIFVEIYSYGKGQEKLPQKIKDVYTAFVATDIQETLNIMNKYSASYVLVFAPTNPSETYYWEINRFFQCLGLNFTEYVEPLGIPNFTFTDLGNRTMIAHFVYNLNTEPFKLVYSDEYIKIYQLKQ